MALSKLALDPFSLTDPSFAILVKDGPVPFPQGRALPITHREPDSQLE
jgi:hypothetical protein